MFLSDKGILGRPMLLTCRHYLKFLLKMELMCACQKNCFVGIEGSGFFVMRGHFRLVVTTMTANQNTLRNNPSTVRFSLHFTLRSLVTLINDKKENATSMGY